MNTRTAFWNRQTKTNKALLVVGLVIGSPVVAVLIIFAGSQLAFRFLTETK